MLNTITHPNIDAAIEATDFLDKPPTPEKPRFSFNQFSITNQLDAMKTQMLNDVFVLDGIALLGQLTAIYAKPNTGKTLLTLWMLTESIKAGRIKGENVYYINADDTYKGLLTKGEVAKKHGFSMIAPSFMEFKVEDFNNHLRQLIADDSARGVIIVLDTLKKFTDLMDKKKGSEFMKLAREFASNGGTMIMLAHTNKNRSFDGKVVAGGTSDITDDCDCAYTLDEVQGNSKTHKDVLFENFKSRGNVKKELLATYATSDNASITNYHNLLNSVQIASGGDIDQAKKERDAATKALDDKNAIDAITDAIKQGNHKKADLLKFVTGIEWRISHRKAKKALDDYTGTKLSNSSLWRVQIGERNSQIYYLLSDENVSAEEYEIAKNG
jgi:archaellum biogenesis ATPase FlaH